MGMSYTGINTFLYIGNCGCPHQESQQCNCILCELELIKKKSSVQSCVSHTKFWARNMHLFLASVLYALMPHGLPF